MKSSGSKSSSKPSSQSGAGRKSSASKSPKKSTKSPKATTKSSATTSKPSVKGSEGSKSQIKPQSNGSAKRDVPSTSQNNMNKQQSNMGMQQNNMGMQQNGMQQNGMQGPYGMQQNNMGMQQNNMGMQQNNMQGPYGMGSMYGMGGPMNGSMYGGNNMGMNGGMGGNGMSQYGSMMGGMGGMGGYGMGGSAYGSFIQTNPDGSQYSLGMMPMQSILADPVMGSIYGQLFSSMYGPMSGQGGYFGGSLYGGSLFGGTGSLYGTGGSLYGGNDMGSVMGSMYGMGSMYESFRPHTSLGVVRKADVPFSYTFQSGMGTGLGQQGLSSRPSAFLDVRDEMNRKNSFIADRKGLQDDISRGGLRETRAVSGSGDAMRDKNGAAKEENGRRGADTNASTASMLSRDVPSTPKSGAASHLNSNAGMHTLAVVHKTSSSKAKCTSDTVTIGKTVLKVNEVVETDEKAKFNSKRVHEMIDHICAGHSAALLVCDDGKSEKALPAFLTTVLEQLFEKVDETKKNIKAKFVITGEIASIRPGEMKDLTKSGSSFVPFQSGGNPLLGPALVGLEKKSIASCEQYKSLITDGLKAATKSDKLILCTAAIKKTIPSTSNEPAEVTGSVFNLIISCDGPAQFVDISSQPLKLYSGLFRHIFGGPCFAVATLLLSDSNEDCANVCKSFENLSRVKNVPPRSGNIRRFLDYTKNQAGKIPAEHLQSNRLQIIIKDAQRALEDENAQLTIFGRVESSDQKGGQEKKNRDLQLNSNTATSPEGENRNASVLAYESESSKGFKINDKTLVSGGSSFDFTETIPISALTSGTAKSKEMTQTISRFIDGYNCSVLSFDGQKAPKGPFDSPCWNVAADVVETALSQKVQTSTVRASLSFIRENSTYKDAIEGSSWGPAKAASSPLYGPVVHEANMHTIKSKSDFNDLIAKAKKNNNKWESDAMLYCVIVYFYQKDDECFVSSFLITLVPQESAQLYTKASSQSSSFYGKLLRYAIGGSCMTRFLVVMRNSDDENNALLALKVQRELCKEPNRKMRKGTLKEFVNFTDDNYKKREKILAELTPSEREKLKGQMSTMKKMLDEYQECMKSPKTNFPGVYSPEEMSGASVSTDKCKLIAFVPRPCNGETFLTVDGTEFPFEEIVQYERINNTTSTKPSVVMAELEKDYLEGHNCAILSASSLTVSCAEEAVWMYFQNAIVSAFKNKAASDSIVVDLAFAVVSESTLEADLLADSHTATPLKMHTSPLVNSMIDGIELNQASSENQVESIIRKALEKASPFLPNIRNGNLLMVGYALLHRLSNGTVYANSLTGTLSGPQTVPYKEVLDRSNVPRVSIFTGPLQGPCRTVVCVNYKNEEPAAKNMTTTLSQISKSKVMSNVRPVNEFVKSTLEKIENTKTRMNNSALEENEKKTFNEKMSKMSDLVEKHKVMLKDFKNGIPFSREEDMPSNTTRQQRSTRTQASNPSKVSTIAIVTKGRSDGAQNFTVVDETNVKFGSEEIPFTEAISRPDNSSTIRSVKMDEMTDLALNGFNGAILMTETANSKACVPFATRVLRNIFAQMPPKGEAYYNIYGIKDDDKVKDYVKGDAYQRRNLLTSPLFGPCYENPPMEPLKNEGAFESALQSALQECSSEKALCVALVVFKFLTESSSGEKDVSLSSLLISIDGTGTCEMYQKLLYVEKKKRGMFQYALGGSCQTIAVMGATEDAEKETLKKILESIKMLGGVEGTTLRNGSVRRFVEYTEHALQTMKSNLEKVPPEEAERLRQTRLVKVQAMYDDSAALLEKPEGRKPPLYATA